MGYTANVEKYILVDDCKDGGLYRIYARNFSLGVYNKQKQGFIGIRRKFTMIFLDMEFHWDTGVPYGTVKPYKFIGYCPEDVDEKNDNLFKWLKEMNDLYL